VIRRAALLTMAGLVMSSCAVLGLSTGCSGTEVIADFEQVGDLVVAANVQSADVKIGSIQEIELDHEDWVAKVTMCIDEDEKIPRDVEAVIRTTSLLGEKFVDFRPRSQGPPFLQDGDILGTDQTSKATELEDVFAELGSILGEGNLHQINAFTNAQARILQDHEADVREVMSRLRRFTDVLAARKGDIATGIDALDDVSRTALLNSSTLERFLDSFGKASGVLADQKEGLQSLLTSLDQFTNVATRLLDATEEGLTKQFARLRPVLRTLLNNSENLGKTLRTLAQFSDWFPETMPGDYLQLDVCQALETHTQGVSCPQSETQDNPNASGTTSTTEPAPDNDLEEILRRPLEGAD
jgi:phospholipid/cholesterol/gamma-HCH transport system substrate-binding protein